MKFNQVVNNFSSGEWSPKMRGRTDVQQYANACETMTNFIPQVSGGAFRRSGTEHISLDATSAAKLGSFSIPIAWNPGGVSYIIHAASNTANWFAVPASGGTGVAFATGGVTLTGFPSTLRIVAIGDILVCADSLGSIEPFVVYMNGSTPTLANWHTYVDTQNGLDEYHGFPYRGVEANGSSHTLTPGATTGNTSLTSSVAFFNSNHVGAYIKLGNASSTGVARITAFGTSTSVSITVLKDFPAAAAYGSTAGTFWEESAWSTYRGWPRTLTTFQGRLIFGGNSTNPDTLWGSRIANFFDLMEIPFTQDPDYLTYPQDNSRPFVLTPSAAESSSIVGLTSAKTLLINTTKYEIVAYGTQGALGPLDVSFESSTSFGAFATQPVRINNYTTFVEVGGTKIRDVVFSFNEDQYKSTDLSFVASHLVGDTYIESMAATRRNNILWCRLATGKLIGVTLDRDYQVNGWFRCTLAEDATTEGICASGTYFDSLYMITRRGSNYALEQLRCAWEEPDTTALNMVHLDAHSIQYFVTPGTTFGPFTHLRGKTVSVIADGFYVGEYVVSDDVAAQIVLTDTVNNTLAVGLPYTAIFKTMPAELGQQIPGGSQGLMKRINEITIKFWNTHGAQYGRKESDLFDINFKDVTTPMDTPQPLFTGAKTLKFPGNYDPEVQVIIQQNKPWPCNVLSVAIRGQTND